MREMDLKEMKVKVLGTVSKLALYLAKTSTSQCSWGNFHQVKLTNDIRSQLSEAGKLLSKNEK